MRNCWPEDVVLDEKTEAGSSIRLPQDVHFGPFVSENEQKSALAGPFAESGFERETLVCSVQTPNQSDRFETRKWATPVENVVIRNRRPHPWSISLLTITQVVQAHMACKENRIAAGGALGHLLT